MEFRVVRPLGAVSKERGEGAERGAGQADEPGLDQPDAPAETATGDPTVPAAAALPPPCQLPPDVADFTGREEQVRLLHSLIGGREGSKAVVISAIAGRGGVGKTALAIHWAHQAVERFPDGQLYVDLRGYSNGPPLRPIQALTQLLGALGVDADRVPIEVDQAAGLYRSFLGDRRMLVVLDNAHSAEQVRQLLPGSPGCVVVITSRDRLAGLIATHGARRLTLDVLPPAEAVALLGQVLGAERLDAEPEAALELARVCGLMPLALRIAAANLVDQPGQPIADYASSLRDGDRLAGLAVDGDPQTAVLATFDLSFQWLDEGARRMFRLLGLAPGPELMAPAAAALAGITPQQAGPLLDRLVGAHLIEPRGNGRYALHDLLRLYSQRRARLEEAPLARKAAIRRLLAWYLHSADAAAKLLYPQILRLPVPEADPRTPPPWFSDHTGALAWLDAERVNLVATVTQAARHGPRPAAWLLADALRGYFWLRRHMVDAMVVARAGLAAATQEGDRRALASIRFSLGDAHESTGRYPEAIEHYTVALALARDDGWEEGEAATLGNLANVYADMGDPWQAADHYAEALALDRRLGREVGEINTLGNLGVVYRELGRLREAEEHQSQALALYHRIGSFSGQAICRGNLGEIDRELGNLNQASAHLSSALAMLREVGDRYGEAYVLHNLAAVERDAGSQAEALRLARSAVALAAEVGDQRVQAEASSTLGSVELLRGDPGRALDGYHHALDLARGTGARYPETVALLGLSAVHLANGDTGNAAGHAEQALINARAVHFQVLEGQALTAMAAAYLADRDHEAALEHAQAALAIHRETGHRMGSARALVILGEALHTRGDPDAASSCWREALAVLGDMGSREAERLQARLGDEFGWSSTPG